MWSLSAFRTNGSLIPENAKGALFLLQHICVSFLSTNKQTSQQHPPRHHVKNRYFVSMFYWFTLCCSVPERCCINKRTCLFKMCHFTCSLCAIRPVVHLKLRLFRPHSFSVLHIVAKWAKHLWIFDEPPTDSKSSDLRVCALNLIDRVAACLWAQRRVITEFPPKNEMLRT